MAYAQSGIFVVLVIAGGCAIHKSPIPTFRLVTSGANPVLVPPGIVSPETAQSTVEAILPAGPSRCDSTSGPIAIQTRGKRARLTVTRDALLRQPAGWLNEWTAELESRGCIAPGAGSTLAEQIAVALPLEMNRAFQLLYSSQLDITPGMRIQVVSPIQQQNEPAGSPARQPVETSGKGNSLTVTLQSPANLLGYETAFYEAQAKSGGSGLNIVTLYADRHLGAATERHTQPAANYFQFPADAAFYRVFYEAQQTEYAAIILAARTRAELEQRTRLLGTEIASCQKLNNELCVAVPKQVAINGLVPVMVNGSPTWVTWGTNIGGVVRAAGESQAILGKLAVYKLYRGKAVKVEFDPSSPAIFNLTVTGGEIITWRE